MNRSSAAAHRLLKFKRIPTFWIGLFVGFVLVGLL
jgi:hypothetical protein